MTILLGVNVDHVATLREVRGTIYPDPLQAALESEAGGADGITVHLREDRRHIQPHDVEAMKANIATRLNLEMAATQAMIDFAKKIKPAFCCLVPEKRQELTTEGGLDVAGQKEIIYRACQELASAGILVSLFIDPDEKQIEAAKFCGAPYIELHTGEYADAKNKADEQKELARIVHAAHVAQTVGLIVNAGHGLHYENVKPIAAIKGMHELNIGHSIIARSVFCGIQAAVRQMKAVICLKD